MNYIKNGYFSHQVSAWVITEKCKQALAVQAALERSTDVRPEPVVCCMQGDMVLNVLGLKEFLKLAIAVIS